MRCLADRLGASANGTQTIKYYMVVAWLKLVLNIFLATIFDSPTDIRIGLLRYLEESFIILFGIVAENIKTCLLTGKNFIILFHYQLLSQLDHHPSTNTSKKHPQDRWDLFSHQKSLINFVKRDPYY